MDHTLFLAPLGAIFAKLESESSEEEEGLLLQRLLVLGSGFSGASGSKAGSFLALLGTALFLSPAVGALLGTALFLAPVVGLED